VTTTPLAPLAQEPDRFFDSGGVRIRYRVAGEGEPVVLVHGFVFAMEPSWVRTGVMEALSRDHRVVALDLRGHGESGKPHDPGRYGVEMIRDVLRLMDHLGIERAHLVGYSMGGELALKLLELAPERLLSLVIGGAGWVRAGDFKHRSWEVGADLLARVGPGESISAHVFPDPDARPPAEVLAVFDANDPAALAAVSRGMLGVEVPEAVLRANRVPTLVVFGEHDWIRPSGDAMPGVMASLAMRVIPGQDHGVAGGSDEFKAIVREFIAAHRRPPR
jgi:pimeloyl-ACP methyl ester carboxylesterase